MGKLGKCRFLLIPLLVITFALLFLFDTKPVKAGVDDCITTSDCDWHCDNTPNCTDRCINYDPGSPVKPGDCAWTIANSCTDWGPWTGCQQPPGNFCEYSTCTTGHINDIRYQSCGGGTCTQGSWGGPSCPNGDLVTECKRADGCGGGSQGEWCGYTSTGLDKYWCTDVSCHGQKPDTPTLSSPANGSTVSSATVRLQWNPIDPPNSNWGSNCEGTQVNQYLVFAGPENNKVQVGTVPQGQAYFDYTIPGGSTAIYWYISASNG